MTSEEQILFYCIIWIIVSGIIITDKWRHRSYNSGLTVSYLASLSIIHLIGALIYVFPWYWTDHLEFTLIGFRETSYGLISFLFGNLFLSKLFLGLLKVPVSLINNNFLFDRLRRDNTPLWFFAIGMGFYFILTPILGKIPTLSALLTTAELFAVVGICLGCWNAWNSKKTKKFIFWIALSFIFPFITILNQGFLGFGTSMTIIVLMFVAGFYRPRWKILLYGIIISYFAMGFYQSYTRDRNEIREAVWSGKDVQTRVSRLKNTISDFEWFNPYKLDQLDRINQRLNQNYLIGLAVYNLDYTGDYAYADGETIWDSVIALVPRAIWSDKPVHAGSPDIVSRFTGLIFPEGTSVGVGQPMELYINFGRLGVIIGFLLLGLIISVIDYMSGYYLRLGNYQKFSIWLLPGIAFLNVGGSFVAITASAGAGLIISYLVTRIRIKYLNSNYLLLIIFSVVILSLFYFFYLPILNPIRSYLNIIILIFVISFLFFKFLVPSFRNKFYRNFR